MNIKVTYRQKKSGISMRVSKCGDILISAPLWATKQQIINFVEENKHWIEQATNKMAQVQNLRNEFFDQLPLSNAESSNEARQRLNAIVLPYIKKYEDKLGVKVTGVSYRKSKTRWGSCNPRSCRINFSLYLLLLPVWCIEHVVAHEMVHILVPNHSPSFYELMDLHFPQWREARIATKRIIYS